MISKLSENGIAGFVLANGAMSTSTNGEGDICQKIIENDLVDCMIALPSQLFYTTQIQPCRALIGMQFMLATSACHPMKFGKRILNMHDKRLQRGKFLWPNRTRLLSFVTPFSPNSFLGSFAFPTPKNWWRAVDECRSIFQIDSVNHRNTLPWETSDRMVSGWPLHAYDSENRATLIQEPHCHARDRWRVL